MTKRQQKRQGNKQSVCLKFKKKKQSRGEKRKGDARTRPAAVVAGDMGEELATRELTSVSLPGGPALGAPPRRALTGGAGV